MATFMNSKNNNTAATSAEARFACESKNSTGYACAIADTVCAVSVFLYSLIIAMAIIMVVSTVAVITLNVIISVVAIIIISTLIMIITRQKNKANAKAVRIYLVTMT